MEKNKMKQEPTEQEVKEIARLLSEYNEKVMKLHEFYSKQLEYVSNGQITLRVP